VVLVGDSIFIAGGVSGPVGMGYDGAEFALPTANIVKTSSAKMSEIDIAVFFIQHRVFIG
jgi:hypothetical protein